jgi:hypothetical protein
MSDAEIALHAEKPSHAPCLVTVIDLRAAATLLEISSTDGACSALLQEHLCVLFHAQVVTSDVAGVRDSPLSPRLRQAFVSSSWVRLLPVLDRVAIVLSLARPAAT